MLPLRTILHPTDFSERSEFALRLACALARDYSARLIVLHTVTIPTAVFGEGVVPPDIDAYQEEMSEKLQRLEVPVADVDVERRLRRGDPVAEILRLAEDGACDLIVMGTHGRTGLGRLLMGSVAEQVVRRAPCPVLTVKTPLPETAPLPDAPRTEPVTA